MGEIIKVGMADLKIAKYPDVLSTLGLGSCVGVALYDYITKTIGLAHVMLPDSSQFRGNIVTAKFADTAIDEILDKMIRVGVRKQNIVAKLAGGAQMFNYTTLSSVMAIGKKNAAACIEKLNEQNIPIIAENTGGNFGRTIELYSEDGRLVVKKLGSETIVI